MPSAEFPRTIRRGPLKGQYFATEADYDVARAAVEESPAADVPPSLDGDAPTQKTRRSRKGKVSREMVYAILFPLNVGLWMIPQTRADALTDEEIGRLCDATAKVAAVNPWVERAILASVESSAYVELAVVVGAIAIRRAANHGYLPAHVGEGVAGMFGLGATPEAVQPEPAVPDPSVNGYPAAPAVGSIYEVPSA